MAGLWPAGFGKPPASMPARVTRKHQRSRGLLPRELDLPTVAQPRLADGGEVREHAWDCRGVREHALGGRGLRDRRRIHAADLEKFLGLGARLEVLLQRRRLVRLDPRRSDVAQTRRQSCRLAWGSSGVGWAWLWRASGPRALENRRRPCRLASLANTNAPAASCRGSLTCRRLRGRRRLRFVGCMQCNAP